MFDIIPFTGKPIAKLKSEYKLNDEEIAFLNHQPFNHQNGNTQITENNQVLDTHILSNFENYLMSVANNYATDVLGINNKIVLTHSWMTKNSKGNSHNRHSHPNILFSMVYYLQSKSGQLVFDIEKSILQQTFNFDYQIKDYNVFNSKSWSIDVLTNDIVLFPGDMIHSTTPNRHDEDRIVLGLNFFAKGVFGLDDNYGKLEL